jgi:hypothetical protein
MKKKQKAVLPPKAAKRTGEEHTASRDVNPLWKQWFQAIKRKAPASQHAWVDRAWARLTQMAMPLLARRFHEFDAFVDDMYQQGLSIGYEIALCDRVYSPFALPVKREETDLARTQQVAQRHMSKMGAIFEMACGGTLTEKREFFAGVSKALNQGALRGDGTPVGATSRYKTLWKLHENADKVQKFKSIAELHKWLRGKLGKNTLNPKALEKLCQEIGLTLTPPGRPSGC